MHVRGCLATLSLVSFVACSEYRADRIGTVHAVVQTRPGGPAEEVDMAVFEAPVNPASVAAADSSLKDQDLVLGIVVQGQAMAYPIRYLASHEVLNDRVKDTSIAPTW